MDQRINGLKSTTFSGLRLTRKQISTLLKTVAMQPNDSRNELAKPTCEYLNWMSAKGKYRVGACHATPERLEAAGILALPKDRQYKAQDMAARLVWTSASDAGPKLSNLRPLRLEPDLETEG